MDSCLTFLKEYGMGIYNTITIALSIFALYQLYIAQPKRENFKTLLNEIISILSSTQTQCNEFWCNPNLLNREVYILNIKTSFKNIETNLTIIDSKHKKKLNNIMELVKDFNEIKDKATGGCFEVQPFRIDPSKAETLSKLTADFITKLKLIQ